MAQLTVSRPRWFAALAAAGLVLPGLVFALNPSAAGAGALRTHAQVEPEADVDPAAEAADAYGRLPIPFAANRGQAPAEVKFMAAGRGYSLALTSTEAALTLSGPMPPQELDCPLAPAEADTSVVGAVVRMRLADSNLSPAVVGLERLLGVANYLIGSDPSKWHTDVPTYAKVAYRDVYPGIDLIWYGHEGQPGRTRSRSPLSRMVLSSTPSAAGRRPSTSTSTTGG